MCILILFTIKISFDEIYVYIQEELSHYTSLDHRVPKIQVTIF